MSDHRIAPSAHKQADALSPHRVLLGLQALFSSDEGEPTGAGTGVEPPVAPDRAGDPVAVVRTIAFVDITGFTAYCDRHGEQAAIEVLTRFRTLVRGIVARRGVRVAKWLGDGAMLVGVDEGPVVASVAELVMRTPAVGLAIHAGITSGTVLLFEGDDYVGRTPNLAARLCDAAESGEILAHSLSGALPPWIEARDTLTVEVAGVGEVSGVRSLAVLASVADDLVGDGTAA